MSNVTTDCPALGMYARMWSLPGRNLRAERHIQKWTPCKCMKRQLAETLPSVSMIGMSIAFQSGC